MIMATKKKKSNPHIIWSNYNLNLEDWIDDIKERLNECGVDYSKWDEYKFYEEMVEVNNLYFEDEKCTLIFQLDVSLRLLMSVFGMDVEQVTTSLTNIISRLALTLSLVVSMLNGGLILTTIYALVKLTMMELTTSFTVK